MESVIVKCAKEKEVKARPSRAIWANASTYFSATLSCDGDITGEQRFRTLSEVESDNLMVQRLNRVQMPNIPEDSWPNHLLHGSSPKRKQSKKAWRWAPQWEQFWRAMIGQDLCELDYPLSSSSSFSRDRGERFPLKWSIATHRGERGGERSKQWAFMELIP